MTSTDPTPPAPTASGTRDADSTLHFRRVLPLSREEAWAAITASDRTARWFGPWSGEKVPGPITVTMLSEESAPAMPGEILEVQQLEHYVLRTGPDESPWVITMSLESDDAEGDSTTVTLSQQVTDPEEAAMIGPGWDFYLDRLVAAEAGQDPEAITFEPAYIPGLCDHYRGLYA